MKKNKLQKGKIKGVGGWLFLAIVLLIYGVTALFDSGLALKAVTSFIQLLDKVVPVLLIVFILIFIVNLLLEPARVKKYLGSQSGIMGWLTAIVGGVLSTGPVYPWYALLKDLREKGMKTSLAAVFLYSRAVKLPLLPLLVHYFGITYTMVLISYLIVFSIISGLVMERIHSVHTKAD
ncbi:MAG: permease [Gammaproteobacteria bacterium]|nr:permease [Gammaproteobacteria bacterium]